ncbi:2'-5' RNA ligase family protein [Subsaxibacter sp. CAU 1640]|nr:2'-5' RNA ligase family protein [Subsaxibacter sp. CAU 1640]MCK7590980.1 2'-5' RNA ligase family protein [Subsaxibacter sp. CAU 1640]
MLFEFFIIIEPCEKVSNEIQRIKRESKTKFGYAKYVNSKPHITMIRVVADESFEEILKKELSLYSAWMKVFTVNINNFKIFESTNVIYLEHNREEIIALQKFLVEIFRKRLKFSKRLTPFITHPHITIAKPDDIDQFQRNWNYFKHQTYSASFGVNHLTVLKRKFNPDNSEKWDVAFKIELNSAK